MPTPTVVQWLIFRGVGHAQVGMNPVVSTLPVVACGRTAWPGLVKYKPKPPLRICDECSVALGLVATRHQPPADAPALSQLEREAAGNAASVSEGKKKGSGRPSQGSLF